MLVKFRKHNQSCTGHQFYFNCPIARRSLRGARNLLEHRQRMISSVHITTKLEQRNFDTVKEKKHSEARHPITANHMIQQQILIYRSPLFYIHHLQLSLSLFITKLLAVPRGHAKLTQAKIRKREIQYRCCLTAI